MNTERISVNRSRIEEVISRVLKVKEQRQSIFAKDITPPEKPFINLLTKIGAERGQESFAINAFFLTTPVCFGDRTNNVFRTVTNEERIREFSWVFVPKEVVKRDPKYIEASCHKALGLSGYHINRVASSWFYNSTILVEKYKGDIRNLFKKYDGDPEWIVKKLYFRNRAKTSEKKNAEAFLRFGPKLASLVVLWISQYGLYKFDHIEKAYLPIDWQVGRLMVQTSGVVGPDSGINADTVVYKKLFHVLPEICRKNGWDPREVSTTLWTFITNSCSERKHEGCPLEDLCTKYISSERYYRGGSFDPKDNGRYR